ncbi:hypothetical protein BGZ74_002239 [Mortierella antarctica]|nr:hypothetical protein BGZ74_002239 [Mortierella antarctica]
MHSRSLLTIVLLAIFGFLIQVHGAPPPPPSDLLKLAGPNEGAIYYVHDRIHIKVQFEGGKNNELYKSNKKIKFIIQKRIPMPALNELVATVKARDLYKAGEFVFEAKKEYIIDQQKSIPYRIRAAWDGGYSDSNGFYIKK